MREIKFRGKKVSDGEWLYGDLMHDNIGGCYIYPNESENLYKENAIIPETVGQFTEAYDANGEEIYEGDILCEIDTNRKVVVIYDAPQFCFADNVFGYGFLNLPENFVVIGNIHDNPETTERRCGMSKGFDIPHNKHLGNSHDYWKALQANSKQIVVQSLQWLPIDRDENGFATEECLDKIFNNLPCAVCFQAEGGCKYYFFVNKYLDMAHNPEEVRANTGYTHYLPIPKLESMSFISLREKLGGCLPKLYEMLTEDLRHSNMDSYEIKRLLLDVINHISAIDDKIKQLERKENINKINRQYE